MPILLLLGLIQLFPKNYGEAMIIPLVDLPSTASRISLFFLVRERDGNTFCICMVEVLANSIKKGTCNQPLSSFKKVRYQLRLIFFLLLHLKVVRAFLSSVSTIAWHISILVVCLWLILIMKMRLRMKNFRNSYIMTLSNGFVTVEEIDVANYYRQQEMSDYSFFVREKWTHVHAVCHEM